MSAYENLQMFYKAQEIKDPWALGHYLAGKYGSHTQQEYATALEDKRDAKEWNPVSAAARAKKEKAKAKKEKAEDKPKKERAAGGTKKYGSPGRQASMRGPGFDKSLDESLEILNLLKAKMDEEKPKIKEDDKDEHEDKEPIKDPFAVASWRAEREGHDLSTDKGKDRRKEIVDDIKDEGNVETDKDKDVKKSISKEKMLQKNPAALAAAALLLLPVPEISEPVEHENPLNLSHKKGIKKATPLQKISPDLAGLMAAAAGWAMSDDIVRSGGGSPRGEMTPQQVREWERTLRRTMRKKDMSLDKSSWEELQKTYYDDSDLYFRRVPVPNAVDISKDHAPVPPRQGLQWDELKKKWVSPDHLGRSASELQGKKRIRGSGTGVHEHSLHVGGAGGKGVGSGVAGRRFRSVGDAGVQSPHESKHVAGYKRRTGGHAAPANRTSSARKAMANKARSHARSIPKVARMAAPLKGVPEARGPRIKQ